MKLDHWLQHIYILYVALQYLQQITVKELFIYKISLLHKRLLLGIHRKDTYVRHHKTC